MITEMDKPMVSVCMITYNHEAFIAKAIEGVLMQELDDEIELIIADDASPDNTEDVVREIMKNHPKGSCIKYHKHETNIGMMKNFSWALERCRGKYVALCEGDDYWIDPMKLKLQVDFLENNLDCSFCFHQAYKAEEALEVDKCFVYPARVDKEKLTIKDFFRIGGRATASVCFRNFTPQAIVDLDHLHGDFLLYLSLFERGIGGFIPRPMSVYRVHSGGISKKKGSYWYLRRRINELRKERIYFNSDACKSEINKQYVNHLEIFVRRFKRYFYRFGYLNCYLSLLKCRYINPIFRRINTRYIA